MATNTNDRVQQISYSVGTGSFTPGGAVLGFRSWADGYPSPTSLIPYIIEAVSNVGTPTGEWEAGIGSWNGTSLVRDVVTSSSNANSIVNFSAGTKLMSVALTSSAFQGKANVEDLASGLSSVATTAANDTLAARNFAVQRTNHTGTQPSSTISDFAAATRTQVTAQIQPGSNVSLTPAGSGASQTLTISASLNGPIETSGLTLNGPGFVARRSAGIGNVIRGFFGDGLNFGASDILDLTTQITFTVPVADRANQTIVGAALTSAVRRANGLNADGTGTRTAWTMPVVIAPGTYRLRDWNPLDAAGNPLSVILYAFPGTVVFENELALPGTGNGAGIAISIGEYQHANRIQQQVTAIEWGRSPRAIGVTSETTQDDIVTVVTVNDALAYKINAVVQVISGNVLPYTGTSAATAKIGETARIMDIRPETNQIYLHSKLEFQDHYDLTKSPADGSYVNTIWLTQYDERIKFRADNIEFRGAPTAFGNTPASTPDQLDHGMFGRTPTSIVSINKTSNTSATVVTAVPHNLITGSRVRIQGAAEAIFNIISAVTVVNSTTYTINLRAFDDWNVTFSPAVSAYANGIRTDAGVFHVDAYPNLDSGSHNACVEIEYVVRPELNGCRVINAWNQGLRFVGTPEGRITNLYSYGSPNHGTSLDNDIFGSRLGYIVSVNGSCGGFTWEGGLVYNARHAYTDGSGKSTGYTPTVSSAGSAWYKIGIPTKTIVRNVTSFDAWGIPFDQHEDGSGHQWIECHAYRSRRGPGGGSYQGQDWHIRGRNTSVINCSSTESASHSLRVSDIEILGNGVVYQRANTTTPVYGPLLFTVTSITRSGTTATVVYAGANNFQNTGAHLEKDQMIRISGADQANYNGYHQILTHDETTKTLTFTVPSRDSFATLFPVAPTSVVTPATGTITLQPFLRNTHYIHNFRAKDITRGPGSALEIFEQSSIRWKNQIVITGGLHVSGCGNAISAPAGAKVSVDRLVFERARFDINGSITRPGRGIVTETDGEVQVGVFEFDATDSLCNAFALFPVSMRGTSRVQIGHMIIKQHAVQQNPPLVPAVFEDNNRSTATGTIGGKFAGMSKLSIMDISGRVQNFRVFASGHEADFTWLGGGEEIIIPVRSSKELVGASESEAGWRPLGTTFVARTWTAQTRTAATSAITVDVDMNTVSIFGATKLVIPAAGTVSGVPSYSQMTIPGGSVLSVDTITTGSEPARGLAVTASGFWV